MAQSQESSDILATASCEDKYIALSQWWERHNKSFSEWFLRLTTVQQRQIVLEASPDMPLNTPGSREAAKVALKATDMILPELSQEALLAAGGKLLVLLLTRRLVSQDLCFHQDVLLLHSLRKTGNLPSFSGGKLEAFSVPFIDPIDPEESIRTLPESPAPEQKAMVDAHLESGRFVHAEAWLALKVRRAALVFFIEILVQEHESAVVSKLSPSYSGLLRAELEQQAAFAAGCMEELTLAEGEGAVPGGEGSSSSGSCSSSREDQERAVDAAKPAAGSKPLTTSVCSATVGAKATEAAAEGDRGASDPTKEEACDAPSLTADNELEELS